MKQREKAVSRMRWMAAGIILCLSAGALADQPTGQRFIPISINFSQHYQFAACPMTVPPEDSCLAVSLIADVPEFGPVTVTRTAFFNGSLFNSLYPTCFPIETLGSVKLKEGTLDIHGIGNVCFVDGTASYNLIVTGGTGAFDGAIGGGQITVPPPTSNSTGRELWNLHLYVNR